VNNAAGATNVSGTSEMLPGQVTAGSPTPTVWIYWGTSNQGTNKGLWEQTIPIGIASAGFSATVSLLPARTYYYCCYASNGMGEAWSPVTGFASDDLSQWSKKMRIAFTGYTPPGGGTLTNFPALVILSNTTAGVGFNYSDFKSPPYGDLRFASLDMTMPLNFEVEKWDTNGLSYVWVQVPVLTGPNTTVYAVWGKSGTAAITSQTGMCAVCGHVIRIIRVSSGNSIHPTPRPGLRDAPRKGRDNRPGARYHVWVRRRTTYGLLSEIRSD